MHAYSQMLKDMRNGNKRHIIRYLTFQREIHASEKTERSLRVYSDRTRRVKFEGYNFAGFKSAFTLSASSRCACIADIPFTPEIILLLLLTLETWLLLLIGSFPCLGFSSASIIERIPTNAAIAAP